MLLLLLFLLLVCKPKCEFVLLLNGTRLWGNASKSCRVTAHWDRQANRHRHSQSPYMLINERAAHEGQLCVWNLSKYCLIFCFLQMPNTFHTLTSNTLMKRLSYECAFMSEPFRGLGLIINVAAADLAAKRRGKMC